MAQPLTVVFWQSSFPPKKWRLKGRNMWPRFQRRKCFLSCLGMKPKFVTTKSKVNCESIWDPRLNHSGIYFNPIGADAWRKNLSYDKISHQSYKFSRNPHLAMGSAAKAVNNTRLGSAPNQTGRIIMNLVFFYRLLLYCLLLSSKPWQVTQVLWVLELNLNLP